MPEPSKPFVVKKNPWVGVAVTVVAGVFILGFILFGVTRMSKEISGDWLTGTIVKKEFRPRPTTEITVGSGGLKSKEVKGDYLFEVKTISGGRTYTVFVDEPTYRAHSEGDRFKFLKPPPAAE